MTFYIPTCITVSFTLINLILKNLHHKVMSFLPHFLWCKNFSIDFLLTFQDSLLSITSSFLPMDYRSIGIRCSQDSASSAFQREVGSPLRRREAEPRDSVYGECHSSASFLWGTMCHPPDECWALHESTRSVFQIISRAAFSPRSLRYEISDSWIILMLEAKGIWSDGDNTEWKNLRTHFICSELYIFQWTFFNIVM